MIDVIQIVRQYMLDQATIYARVGNQIYGGEVPTSVTDAWTSPEEVTETLFLETDIENDSTVPVARGEMTVNCYAPSVTRAIELAEIVVDALDDTEGEDVLGHRLAAIDHESGPDVEIDPELGWRSAIVTFAIVIIE